LDNNAARLHTGPRNYDVSLHSTILLDSLSVNDFLDRVFDASASTEKLVPLGNSSKWKFVGCSNCGSDWRQAISVLWDSANALQAVADQRLPYNVFFEATSTKGRI
jgi:hypothetical protein